MDSGSFEETPVSQIARREYEGKLRQRDRGLFEAPLVSKDKSPEVVSLVGQWMRAKTGKQRIQSHF